MNKQEGIEKIKNIDTLKINDTVSHQQIDMVVKNQVLDIISQIDELQKVVVPKFVAEYIEYCKHEKFYALHGSYANMDDRLAYWRFKGNNSELFAKAWLYGYEIEKEKLYTAMLKISGEYLRLNWNGNFCHFKVNRKYVLDGDGARGYQFTEDDLVKYHIWGNDNYEVKEVEE